MFIELLIDRKEICRPNAHCRALDKCRLCTEADRVAHPTAGFEVYEPYFRAGEFADRVAPQAYGFGVPISLQPAQIRLNFRAVYYVDEIRIVQKIQRECRCVYQET